MRLIDADELMDALNEAQNELDEYYLGLKKAKRIVSDMDTFIVTTRRCPSYRQENKNDNVN